MQKVYLLLRNNQQTGPFTLDELLPFDLKPFDLIWIEGKSAGWYYPQEIEALRPHLSFLQKATSPVEAAAQNLFSKTEPAAPKKIFVSMPSAMAVKEPVQQTLAKPLPTVEQKTQAFANSIQPERPEAKTTYAKSLAEVETDYMNWAYQKKTKKKPLFSKSGVIVLCLLAAALFATWKLANKPPAEVANTPPQQSAAGVQPALMKPENSVVEQQPSAQKAVTHVAKTGKATKNVSAIDNTIVVASKPVKKNPAAVVSNNATKSEEEQPAPVTREDNKSIAEEKSEPATSAEAPKEKKSLKERIHDLFHKKTEEKTETAKPVETDNGARQSTRREAGSSLVQMVAVKFDIPNSWMMGIKGAKATLTNRSSETLAKAVVEIRYYNDDNDLLDKKTITFGNVKSKQSGTVSVPEHATATRLEYTVISAVGTGEPVARLW